MSLLPIDYRRTFLRRHIARELTEQGRSDIFALEELLQKIDSSGKCDRTHPLVRAHVNRRWYFYHDQPDERLYIPLRVLVAAGRLPHSTDNEHERSKRERHMLAAQAALRAGHAPPDTSKLADGYEDLAELLLVMEERRWHGNPPDHRGVALVSHSGGGKTSASRKAFYDCLFATATNESPASGSRPAPRLSGFVPCWLPLPQSLGGQSVGSAAIIIQQLKAAADETPGGPRTDQIKQWLELGPRLLVFVDLNQANDTVQLGLAQSLVSFQAEFGRYGHRCVVAYRSTREDAPPLVTLSQQFGLYELQEFNVRQAQAYLANLRRAETMLLTVKLQALNIPHTPAADSEIEQDCQKLGELVARTIHKDAVRSASLVSTPLVTHLVASLGGERLKRVHTLYDLYAEVIDGHLKREQRQFGNRLTALTWNGKPVSPGDWQFLAQSLMTRFALATLHRGRNSVRLQRDEWDGLLQQPDVDATGGRPSWWPQDEFWHAAPYFTVQCQWDESSDWLEFSLLSAGDGQIGFIHDSLIYHYAGAKALVEYQSPVRVGKLNDDWMRQLPIRLAAAPELWILPARFLAGRLAAIDRERRDQGSFVEDVLIKLLLQCDCRDWVEILITFTEELRPDELLTHVHASLTCQKVLLRQVPQETPAVVVNHLNSIPAADARLRAFATRLETALAGEE